MAVRDYICCSVCKKKLIYDGYNRVRDAIDILFGVSEDNEEYSFIVTGPCCSPKAALIFRARKNHGRQSKCSS